MALLLLLALPGPDIVQGGQFPDESENHREMCQLRPSIHISELRPHISQ
jgi:hypothetical protein